MSRKYVAYVSGSRRVRGVHALVHLDIGGQEIYPEGPGVLLTLEDLETRTTYEISLPGGEAFRLGKSLVEAGKKRADVETPDAEQIMAMRKLENSES